MALLVNIKKRLGSFCLDVHFETGDGVFGILGASGCGKSMTLKCIAGIERPDAGRVELDGRVLFDAERHIDLPPQKRLVGYLFQQYALFPNMTVEQNILSGAVRLPKAERRNAAAQMMEAFRLTGLEGKYPAQLSGGQQQRTALARILVNRPQALLLDEPFSALDEYLRWQVELELADVLKHFSGPTLLVSHSRDEVFRLCERVCVLSAGRSEAPQDTARLFRSPETLSACLLSGCKNYTRIRRIDGNRAHAVDWGVDIEGAYIPPDATCAGIRAHFVRPRSGPNAIPCRVERVIDDLFSTVVMLTTPGGESGWSRLRMELSRHEWASLGTPESLTVSLLPEDIMFLRENGYEAHHT